jgi:hypothetical protein
VKVGVGVGGIGVSVGVVEGVAEGPRIGTFDVREHAITSAAKERNSNHSLFMPGTIPERLLGVNICFFP